VARGAAVRAPCLFRGPCPALLKPSDWCHAERPIAPPPLVAQIGKAAGLRKEAVKMSYLVLAPPGEGWAEPPAAGARGDGSASAAGARGDGAASTGRVFRIVSEPLAGKGRLRYMGCGPEGRMGLALQEKHVGAANRAFESLLRGDVVALHGAEPKGDGIALGAGSAVTVIAPAGRPVPAGPPPAAPPA
jgi:ribosomal protein RSM22 (predicted rRNA methylase)